MCIRDSAEAALLAVFETLAQHHISVDFINVYLRYAVFTIKDADAGKAATLLDNLDVTYTQEASCCKVSVVGANITGVPGVMAQIMQALEMCIRDRCCRSRCLL